MTGHSTPAQGGVTDDPIRIGTMLYTLVEPHRGHLVAPVGFDQRVQHRPDADGVVGDATLGGRRMAGHD